eukprot:322154-Hanusia_phi.AAC.1
MRSFPSFDAIISFDAISFHALRVHTRVTLCGGTTEVCRLNFYSRNRRCASSEMGMCRSIPSWKLLQRMKDMLILCPNTGASCQWDFFVD